MKAIARGLVWITTLLILACQAADAANENTTIVFHAAHFDSAVATRCESTVDCTTVLPTTTVSEGDYVFAFFYVRNHDTINVVNGRFGVEDGIGSGPWGDWTFRGGVFCNAFFGLTQSTGEFWASFAECPTGGKAQRVGWMLFTVGSAGCLTAHDVTVTRCGTWDDDTLLDNANMGRLCVNEQGFDACEPVAVPIVNKTWGAIKAQLH